MDRHAHRGSQRASRLVKRQQVLATLLALAAWGSVLLRHLPPDMRQVAFACTRQTCWPVEPPFSQTEGIFSVGYVDLTGDGVPETILREQDTLRVLQDGFEIWHSDATWRVVDAALGDPNHDGRYEILAALWKPDDRSSWISQPYIIGYRGGTVKVLWGGSAVAYGIHEVALADVDGDNTEELLVLESARQGARPETPWRTLSVWDWHGWGYNLRWRSSAAAYRNLNVTGEGIIVVTRIR